MQKSDLSDDEASTQPRSSANGARYGKGGDAGEGLDSANLLGAQEASKKFRKAERKHGSILFCVILYSLLLY